MSDAYKPYRLLHQLGYVSLRLNHAAKEYARGDISINALEGSWAHFKLSLQAIYVGVSKKHLQKYCAEFAYRYNHRNMDDGERFNDWFDYCKGHVTYKTLIAGMKKPKKQMRPNKDLIMKTLFPEQSMHLPDIEDLF